MSAAERLGMFTSSGAHYPAKPECPHAAGRTNAGKNKSSQCARVIYLLRQTPLAYPASCVFARGEASRWLTSALTRRVPSHVPSSPSLHGAPHSVRGCLIVARRGQQSLAIQSKANGKAGTGAVRNRLFRLEICMRSSQGISVRRDRIVHRPLKNAGKVHRETGNPKRGFKAAKKEAETEKDATTIVAEVYKEVNIDQKSSENSPYSKPSFTKTIMTTSTVDDEEAEEESEEEDDDDEEEEEDEEEEDEDEEDDEDDEDDEEGQ